MITLATDMQSHTHTRTLLFTCEGIPKLGCYSFSQNYFYVTQCKKRDDIMLTWFFETNFL